MNDINEMQKSAVRIARQYRQLGVRKGYADWTARDYLSGFTKDLGDLSKLLMIKDGLRDDASIDNLDEKIGHELSDCLWSVFVIADKLDVDLAASFRHAMEELDTRLQNEEGAS